MQCVRSVAQYTLRLDRVALESPTYRFMGHWVMLDAMLSGYEVNDVDEHWAKLMEEICS